MKAITVRLPYAAAIAAGVKLVENRGRPTEYRGPVAIHAAASWSKPGGRDSRILRWWWGDHPRRQPQLDSTDFSPLFRQVIAVADLVDCHQADQTAAYATCCRPWGDREYGDRPGSPAWHLVLANMARIRPVPAVGRLSVPWTLPDGVAERVAAQLAAVK